MADENLKPKKSAKTYTDFEREKVTRATKKPKSKKEIKAEKKEAKRTKTEKSKPKSTKKFLLIAVCLIVIVLIFAGIFIFKPFSTSENPEEAVLDYFGAVKEFNLEKLLLTVDPAKVETLEKGLYFSDEEDSVQALLAEFVREKSKDITCSVLNVAEVTDATAKVTVEVSYMDWPPYFEKISKLVVNKVIADMLAGVEVTGDSMNTIVENVLYPDTMKIIEPEAPKTPETPESETAAKEKEELDVALLAEKEKREKELAVDVKKLKKQLKISIKKGVLEVNCVKVDDVWYVTSLSSDVLTTAWLGVKNFSDEIYSTVGIVGITKPEPAPKEGEK